jgi:signal transduction histidine kinase
MNPISAFFVRNIIVVFFFYGLAFFAMGLALLLASRRTSEFRFASAIIPLAIFGLLHGTHEWVEMFQKISVLNSGYTPTIGNEVLRLVLLVASFALLLAFGLILLNTSKISSPRVWLPIAVMIGLWLLAVVLINHLRAPLPEELLAQADALARFGLGIPAALLGAWALMTQQRTFREHGMPQFGRDLVWAATALLLYGVVGQIFVRATSLFPTTFVNSTVFLQWFGIPVQLFRGVAAAVLAVFMIRALNAFELESQRRLGAANQAKLDAQAEALETERRIRQERERLNAELRQTAHELGLLLEFSNLLASPMALQDRLDAVLQRLVDSLSFPNAGMILLAETPSPPQVRAATGWTFLANGDNAADSARELAYQLGQRCVIKDLVICRHADGSILELSLADIIQRPQCHLVASPVAAIGLPLHAQQQVIGSLVLGEAQLSPLNSLGREEIELLAGVARQLGLSIENAQLYHAAQEREEMLAKLLEQVVAAQEAERQRIARELHDATGQSLTAIGLGLRGVEALLDQSNEDGGDPRVIKQIRDLKSFSTHALGELRQIIADLRPSILDDMGLAAALKWYVQSFEQRRSIQCTFVQEGPSMRLPTNYETVLFRITQEALTNIAKHAQASQVTVKLETFPAQVRLCIADNGRGFDPQKAAQTGATGGGGWGLLGMRERAALLDGQLEIDSAPGRGARVCVTVPLTSELRHAENQAIAR